MHLNDNPRGRVAAGAVLASALVLPVLLATPPGAGASAGGHLTTTTAATTTTTTTPVITQPRPPRRRVASGPVLRSEEMVPLMIHRPAGISCRPAARTGTA